MFLALLVTSVVIVILIAGWMFQLDATIRERLQGKRFLPPVEFYSAPMKIAAQESIPLSVVQANLKRMGYVDNESSGPLQPGQFLTLSPIDCQNNLSDEVPPEVVNCLLIKRLGIDQFGIDASSRDEASDRFDQAEPERKEFMLITFNQSNRIDRVYGGEPLTARPFVELEPVLFAQYYGGSPILRDVVSLGDVPPLCLNAILAIEDARFLEHGGFSFRGLARAAWTNLVEKRAAQGGSTITQQLVKNYFLTPEKTLKRKITEIVMSILLEARATKDEILETYINEIYMGQNPPFEVRGLGAAATHYLAKNISDLDLADCALLAAILNNPGLYNPFLKAENATKRRSLVLSRMEELQQISADEKTQAEAKPLPKSPARVLTEPAPYFVDAVRRELERGAIPIEQGARIFTTLDLRAQEAALRAVRTGLDKLESQNKKIQRIKTETSKSLEAALVSADPTTGEVSALVGGRSFRQSQFNRAYQAKRQIGSIFKPIVYAAALEHGLDGEPLTPISLLKDERFTVRYEGQSWSPTNYDRKERGLIPVFYALSRSLNIPTAQLGIQVGLERIVEFAENLGIKAELKPVPALTLGAFEMTPMEVLQVYSTFANFGERVPLSFYRRIETLDGELLYASESEAVRVQDKVNAAILLGMMKQTVQNGTAWFLKNLGFRAPAAGKTGTTSDTKDAWFAGMTPQHVAVVWVGYDDNTESSLTGASGAVPIWADYMKSATSHLPELDFEWPEEAVLYTLGVEQLIDLNVPEDERRPLEPVELIFRTGTSPSTPQ